MIVVVYSSFMDCRVRVRHRLVHELLEEEPFSTQRSEREGLDSPATPFVRVFARENQTSKGLPPYQNQCFPGAGIMAIRSLRSVVSRSSRRIRLRNFCSRNHSFTHTSAASSSFTVIIMVVWLTIQCQRLSGTARSDTLTPPIFC